MLVRSLLALALLGVTPALADTPGIEGSLEQSATTSPKEKVEFARSAVDEIGTSVKTVEKLLEQATKDKDEEAKECLTRKLTAMKALHEVVKVSNNNMQQALASSDMVHADLEFRKVAVALAKTRDFLAEAHACVGKAGAERGDSAVAVNENMESLVDPSVVEEGVVEDVVPDDPSPK
ncbi:MAG: hypothetical protein ACOZNI_03310 [Myxococcota bacterium]